MKSKPVRIAIIGTGGMAAVHAQRFQEIRGCAVVAACDIDLARAKAFAERHGILKACEGTAQLFAEADFDAVSIVTPDAAHFPVAMQCLQAGKHVLCEKPLALNATDAKEMAKTAKQRRLINMVNFSYRDWSAIQGAAAAVARGDIGEVRHVEASYLQAWLVSKAWGDWKTTPAWLWRLSTKHGSKGALGDVGVHIVDFATFPVGPIRELYCRLKTFPKAPGNRIGDYRLDANDSAIINVEFANGAIGTIHTTRWAPGHANRLALKISGTAGTLSIDSDLAVDSYQICAKKDVDSSTWKTVKCKPTPHNYRRFVDAIRTGKNGTPDFARGAEVQSVLDACFESDKSNAVVKIKK